MPKLITSNSRKILVFLSRARIVYTSLSNHPNFQDKTSEFAADLAKLSEGIDRLQRAYDEAMTRDSQKISYRDKLRDEVAVIMGRIARHVELAANGDVDKMRSSGFGVSQGKGNRINKSLPLPAPVLTLKHGPLPGTMIAHAKPVPGAASYELYITDSDPSIAEKWRRYAASSSSSHHVGGLTAGLYYSAKQRCIGAAGEGAWSAIVTLMSL